MRTPAQYVLASYTYVFIKEFLFILVMYIVNVNNFCPFDLFILLNTAFRNSNIAFSHAALDICLRCAYNALKQTVRQCPSGSYGDAEAAAGYNYKAYFVIPLFICVDGGPQENLRAAVIC